MTTDPLGAHAPGATPGATGADSGLTSDLSPTATERAAEVEVAVGGKRQDPVRWGAVWSGLLVALATFLLVELIFFWLDWLTIAGTADTSAGVISALIALFAFFVGGLVAGATSIWRGAREGMVHGVLVWALGIVGIIFITLFGGGALFGSVASAVADAAQLQRANLPDVELNQAVDDARNGAGWAVLGLLLSLVAAAVGGVLGTKMGSSRRRDPEHASIDTR